MTARSTQEESGPNYIKSIALLLDEVEARQCDILDRIESIEVKLAFLQEDISAAQLNRRPVGSVQG